MATKSPKKLLDGAAVRTWALTLEQRLASENGTIGEPHDDPAIQKAAITLLAYEERVRYDYIDKCYRHVNYLPARMTGGSLHRPRGGIRRRTA